MLVAPNMSFDCSSHAFDLLSTTMAAASLTSRCFSLLFLLINLLTCSTYAQSCNTNQNPYCRGNAQFEQICCPPGNICYWSNRNGDPACCQAGTDCRGDGGPGPVVITSTPNPTTLVVVTTTSHYTTSCITTTPSTYIVTTTSPTSWNAWVSSTTVYTTPYITTQSPVPTLVVITSTQGLQTTGQPNGVVVTATVTQVAQYAGANAKHKFLDISWLLSASIGTAILLMSLL